MLRNSLQKSPTLSRSYNHFANVFSNGILEPTISTRTLSTSSRSNCTDNPLMLHHEWIIDGKVQSSHTSASSASAASSSSSSSGSNNDGNVIVFLHGLLGNNKNLRTPAKKLSIETGVTALMIDLRGHGLSQLQAHNSIGNGYGEEEPHSIHNCANDVIHTLQQLNLTGLSSPKYMCGHSFGGRCALSYHHILTTSTPTSSQTQVKPPQHTWILDSCPGKAHSSVANVIQAVSSIQMPVRTKQQLVQILTQEKNIDQAIASWMTTNLKQTNQPHEKGFDFMFDLEVVHSILQDFTNQDMMQLLRECMLHSSTVEPSSSSSSNGTIHKIIASRNESWTPDILQELNSIQNMQDANANLNLVTLDAGHWVHIDAFDALLDNMIKEF
jgi:esterase/lipase